jgi:hypothetical protein
MIWSKFLCSALSIFQSSTSRPGLPFLSSLMLASTHSSTAFCISCIASVIGTSSSITSAFFRPSSEFATATWNLGYSAGFCKKRFFIIFVSGANPVVKGSGVSENAFRKPTLFFCLYIRKIKASRDVAMTFSACSTTMPVTVSGFKSPDKKSTIRILEVMLNMPPCAYIFSRVPTLIKSVLTRLSPLHLGALLTAACSASASPIQTFSRSSAPTSRMRLFPAASYEWRRFVTMRRRPRPRARRTSSSSSRSSLKISCWNSYDVISASGLTR